MKGRFIRSFGDGKPALLDGDPDALTGLKAGVLDPSTGKLHPRV
jgi:hypothetical protein